MNIRNTVLLVFLTLSGFTFSQLTIDAGKDTVFCALNNAVYPIGGDPTAINGTSLYTYKWSIKEPYTIPFSSITLHASDFLTDTTISNPNIIDGFGFLDSMLFFLEVEDDIGNIKNDSILVHFSIFSLNTFYVTYNILSGDSVHINYGSSVSGGLGNLSYLWQPNHGLIDSTNSSFWTKPEHSVDYYCIIKDTNNCTVTTGILYHVNVHFLHIEEFLTVNTNPVSLFPNPTSGEVFIKTNTSSIKNICIYDSKMRLLEKVQPNIDKYDLTGFEKGVYIITFEFQNEVISKQIILQ